MWQREERFLDSRIPALAMTWTVMPAGNSPVQGSWDCSLPLVAEPLILAPDSKGPGTLGSASSAAGVSWGPIPEEM